MPIQISQRHPWLQGYHTDTATANPEFSQMWGSLGRGASSPHKPPPLKGEEIRTSIFLLLLTVAFSALPFAFFCFVFCCVVAGLIHTNPYASASAYRAPELQRAGPCSVGCSVPLIPSACPSLVTHTYHFGFLSLYLRCHISPHLAFSLKKKKSILIPYSKMLLQPAGTRFST